jgi:hypothetical protein
MKNKSSNALQQNTNHVSPDSQDFEHREFQRHNDLHDYGMAERLHEIEEYQEDNWVEITEYVVPRKQAGMERMQMNLFEEIA